MMTLGLMNLKEMENVTVMISKQEPPIQGFTTGNLETVLEPEEEIFMLTLVLCVLPQYGTLNLLVIISSSPHFKFPRVSLNNQLL